MLYRLSPYRESRTAIDTQFEIGIANLYKLVKIQSMLMET